MSPSFSFLLAGAVAASLIASVQAKAADVPLKTLFIQAPDGHFHADIRSTIWFDPAVCTFVVTTTTLNEKQGRSTRKASSTIPAGLAVDSDMVPDAVIETLLASKSPACQASLVLDGLRYRFTGLAEFQQATRFRVADLQGLGSCHRTGSSKSITATGPNGRLRLNDSVDIALRRPGAVVSTTAGKPVTLYLRSLDGDIECGGVIERNVPMLHPSACYQPGNGPDSIFSDRFKLPC